MNKKIFLPFTLSSFMFALSGCGGENAKINEDPYSGVKTTSNGCVVTGDNKCKAFVIDYPVEGLNFDCSSDLSKHFATLKEGNVTTGACLATDKVHFYIQGEETSRKIELGAVNLAEIAPFSIAAQPTQIRLLDIAQGMTGKAAADTQMSDDTFKTLAGITRILQAVGVKQEGYVAGDVQPIFLTKDLKNGLSKISENVKASDFIDGTYVSDIKPWLDLTSVDETVAEQTAKQLINLSNVNIYSAEFLLIEGINKDLGGFYGTSQNQTGIESIANLYMITTRQGYTTGYAIQWQGKPKIESKFASMALITEVPPVRLNVFSKANTSSPVLSDVEGWISALSQKITKPLTLKSTETSNDQLEIYQGKLLSNMMIPGTEYVYQQLTGEDKPTTDQTAYGKWRQDNNGVQFAGTIDISKTKPATYLGKEVFLTKNNVKSGENYIFPLYANLIFNFADKTIPSEKIGIVIDENGDIRTNRSQTSLASNQCLNVNASMLDTANVQQYRIGTTVATNSSTNDKSIVMRMILANPIFGNLDGILVGLDQQGTLDAQILGQNTSNGVRMNLQNLIVNKTTSLGINVTGWANEQAVDAKWLNWQAIYQSVYNNAKDNAGKVTSAQTELAKRTNGSIEVELPTCYKIQTK